MSHGFLVHGDQDCVGVAVGDLQAGEKVAGVYQKTLGEIEVILRSPIPLGHKIALTDLNVGDKIIEYNEVIGVVTRDIHRGDHVHVHNVKSMRWA